MITCFIFILGTTNSYGPQFVWFLMLYIATVAGAFIML
jgi:hypothetical protein